MDDTTSSAAGIALLAKAKLRHRAFEDIAYFTPLYLKDIAFKKQRELFKSN